MWVIYKADCGPVNYKLVMNASTMPVPSYVTLKDKKVDVNFNQMPGPGTINLGLLRTWKTSRLGMSLFRLQSSSAAQSCSAFKLPNKSTSLATLL